MKKHLIIVFLFWAISASAQKTCTLQLVAAPQQATLFGEGNVSTPINERDFAISPDGNEIYFTISLPKSTFQTIVFCKRTGQNKWTIPAVAPFAGKYSDLEPAFSADGNTLYFASNRPNHGNEPKDFDIWKVTRLGNAWGEPANLGSIINTEANEFYPSIANNGNLYFTANYQGGPGREDIYMALLQNGHYEKPIPLDSAINTKYYEFNAFVDPNEQFILFTSYGRKDDMGGGDLYISVKDDIGRWTPAKNLKDLNSKQLDYCPFVSPDGKSLFFTSERHDLPKLFLNNKATFEKIHSLWDTPLNGTGNIYWIDLQKVFIK